MAGPWGLSQHSTAPAQAALRRLALFDGRGGIVPTTISIARRPVGVRPRSSGLYRISLFDLNNKSTKRKLDL